MAGPQSTSSQRVPVEKIKDVLRQYWGYDTLRPLQEEAIRAGIEHRDSLVVMPTGGGKSLCYQIPPIVADRTDIVVSPLISLMKDQVDGLVACGYPAVGLHSGLSEKAKRDAEAQIADGSVRLIFVSPERLLTSYFLNRIESLNVRAFSIDEAHCISQWGHDFRQEYRQLRTLKDRFPLASIHAYTATATQQVRDDIVTQLGLRDPRVLVGTFDRPNLTYRVIPRVNGHAQVAEVLARHKGQAAIVYCISRKETEETASALRSLKIDAQPYHAGMSADQRRVTQEAFSNEKLSVVVATVAFGMGIDRSNVRCVIHAGMPKSVESYQQETGRAGRDGLESECVMLYSTADAMRWESLIRMSAENAQDPQPVIDAGMALLARMRRYAVSPVCRHRALSEYFGQAYPRDNCDACDVCLNEGGELRDATVDAQKILSCVSRVGERFGVGHVVDVLRGAETERVMQFRHTELSTYGLMKEIDKKALTRMVYQLLDQGLVARSEGEYPVLKLNAASWDILRGKTSVRFVEAPTKVSERKRSTDISLSPVEQSLFEHLRGVRRRIAEERGVPPFVIFSDATLRELAAVRPGSVEAMRKVRGVGQTKARELGEHFVEHITGFCREQGISLNVRNAVAESDGPVRRARQRPATPAKQTAMEMFARGASIETVCEATTRARSTVSDYLCEYIETSRPADIDAWVPRATQRRILKAAAGCEDGLLKPIFEALAGELPYDLIRIVMIHQTATNAEISG